MGNLDKIRDEGVYVDKFLFLGAGLGEVGQLADNTGNTVNFFIDDSDFFLPGFILGQFESEGLTIKVDNYFLTIYFVFLAIPAIVFVQRLIRADSKRDFYLLSGFSKLIMLSGIISMIFFKLIK